MIEKWVKVSRQSQVRTCEIYHTSVLLYEIIAISLLVGAIKLMRAEQYDMAMSAQGMCLYAIKRWEGGVHRFEKAIERTPEGEVCDAMRKEACEMWQDIKRVVEIAVTEAVLPP